MKHPALPACVAAVAFSLLVSACATSTPELDSKSAATGAVFNVPSVPQQSFALNSRNSRGAATANGSGSVSLPEQRSVYYDLDRYDIKPEYRAAIEENARYLREYAHARVTVQGNGDERGSREYNLALGQRRAEGVRQLMRVSGVPEHQVEAVSFGEEKPKVVGHDEAAWAQNRRSDLVYDRAD
jgi:peptidoglycan-associated lipoprotein